MVSLGGALVLYSGGSIILDGFGGPAVKDVFQTVLFKKKWASNNQKGINFDLCTIQIIHDSSRIICLHSLFHLCLGCGKWLSQMRRNGWPFSIRKRTRKWATTGLSTNLLLVRTRIRRMGFNRSVCIWIFGALQFIGGFYSQRLNITWMVDSYGKMQLG